MAPRPPTKSAPAGVAFVKIRSCMKSCNAKVNKRRHVTNEKRSDLGLLTEKLRRLHKLKFAQSLIHKTRSRLYRFTVSSFNYKIFAKNNPRQSCNMEETPMKSYQGQYLNRCLGKLDSVRCQQCIWCPGRMK